MGIVRLTAEVGPRFSLRHTPLMRTSISPYHRHRFPAEIISHSVWLYFRFTVSFRDVEEMLAMRGVSLSYETVREWCFKFGQTYANGLRRKFPRPGDRWHLDEVFLKINGIHYLWRAVDQDGDVLDILVQSKRDKRAAKKFFRKLLEEIAVCPARDHYRQTKELQRGKS
jgi:putative transposase